MTPVTPLQSLRITIDIPVAEKHLAGVEKAAARSVFQQVNSQWDKAYFKSFTEVLCKIPEAKVRPKPSPSKKKKNFRDMQRKVKNSIENNLNKVDCNTLYGIRQSKSKYEKLPVSETALRRQGLWDVVNNTWLIH